MTRKAVATAMKHPLIQSFLTGTVKSQINPTYICRELCLFQTYFLEKPRIPEKALDFLGIKFETNRSNDLIFLQLLLKANLIIYLDII